MKENRYTDKDDMLEHKLCEPIADYCKATRPKFIQTELFKNGNNGITKDGDIRVVELFAGVGGFRIGLERASNKYKTIWSNQWEPTTKRQDASIIYCRQFGNEAHSNKDIATVPTEEIPTCDMLVGGFPCQDYSVATTLKHSGGIEGKKGVLWWQIYRIISESKEKPRYLFFENVDRLLKSPAKQRGRDFALILSSLSDLGYTVEWRVINAAEYGMPQRRRRTYIVAYRHDTRLAHDVRDKEQWILKDGIIATAFPVIRKEKATVRQFTIEGRLEEVSENFNTGLKKYTFENTGIISDRQVCTVATVPEYVGMHISLSQILVDENDVPEDFFISDEDLPRWKYLKGGKKETRISAEGFEYKYSEGSMSFPDDPDKPSRTIITGEGGKGPSRFKHVVKTPNGRYRRLIPIELERLNMFPDNHTIGVSDVKRAFLMGNALVTGVVEKIGVVLKEAIESDI